MSIPLHEESINASYLLLVSCLVFIMQIGFMALETGSVGTVFKREIIFKNFEDIFIGIISFSILGYSLAFDDEGSSFVGGVKYFALMNVPAADWLFVLFQMCFVGTAATIVSGCVVERMTSTSYAVFSFLLTLIVYPPIVHWAWSADGWLYQWGFVDFAGSGVVHLTGGLAGFVLIFFLRPRVGKDCGIKELDHKDTDLFTVGVGVFLLWVGWFGFNCGSVITLVGDGTSDLVGLIAVNVTVSAAVAGFASNIYLHVVYHADNFDLTQSLNCLLTGLVAITAGCHQMHPWAAAVCGLEATLCYYLYEKLMAKLNIDDPLSVTTVHGMGGILGVINVGIFSDTGDVATAGILYGGYEQLGKQLIGTLVIMVWVTVWIIIIGFLLKYTMGIDASLFRGDQGVKLWEDQPELALKALFIAKKQDPSARVWLLYFRNFLKNVYADSSELLDNVVVIDEFIDRCKQTIQDTNFKNSENGQYDFSKVADTINPWIKAINERYVSLEDGAEQEEEKGGNNNELKLKYDPTSSSASKRSFDGETMSRVQRKMSGIESAGNMLANHYGDNRDIEDLLEMRYIHLFDPIRESALSQLLKPWLIFTKRPLTSAEYRLTPDTVYTMDSDWNIQWKNSLAPPSNDTELASPSSNDLDMPQDQGQAIEAVGSDDEADGDEVDTV